MARERNRGSRRRRTTRSEGSRPDGARAASTPAATAEQTTPARSSSLRRVPRRASSRPEWRERLDSYGGFTMVAVVVALLAFIAVMIWQNMPVSPSEAALRGDEVALVPASHTTNPADLVIPEGRPPAGGPHYPIPLRAGIYDAPVEEGNVIHSLEHGLIWISYNPDRVTPEQVEALKDVAGGYGRDVVLSPRPANSMPIAIVSWGRILQFDDVDRAALKDFIEVNRNRSPEPGVR